MSTSVGAKYCLKGAVLGFQAQLITQSYRLQACRGMRTNKSKMRPRLLEGPEIIYTPEELE